MIGVFGVDLCLSKLRITLSLDCDRERESICFEQRICYLKKHLASASLDIYPMLWKAFYLLLLNQPNRRSKYGHDPRSWPRNSRNSASALCLSIKFPDFMMLFCLSGTHHAWWQIQKQMNISIYQSIMSYPSGCRCWMLNRFTPSCFST